MRVTGGIARGIQLRVPTKGGVRPATDYIREAVFNSLAAFIPQAKVLDLFSGTGAYALDSLSRGALSATAVDLSIGSEIKANMAAVAKSMGVPELPMKTITGDAMRLDLTPERFDCIFADPPWEFWETKGPEIAQAAVAYANPGSDVRVILEAPGGWAVPVPLGWKLKKVIGKGKGQPAASILVRES
jgi:16S rRNA (guanine966-N2)-methyltransferase